MADGPTVAATRAPAAIGALVGAWAAIEISKALRGDWSEALVDRELFVDARHHRHFVTKWSRRTDCPLDHTPLSVTLCLPQTTLREALGSHPRPGPDVVLGLVGDVFAGRVRCRDCGSVASLYRPRARLDGPAGLCAQCGERLRAGGHELVDGLGPRTLGEPGLERPLGDFGVTRGDVVWLAAADRPDMQTVYASIGEAETASPEATVTLVGCGNIGSQIVPHLGRIPGIDRVILIDPDHYVPHNLGAQAITPQDVGRAKVVVQAERLRTIAPRLRIDTHVAALEALPLGALGHNLLVGALDSRRARRALNARAFALGAPWIDTAVDGASLLCRLSVYRPAENAACLECGWDDADYALIERVDACEIGRSVGGAAARGRV